MKNHIITFSILFSLLFSACITDYDGGSFFGQGIKGEGPITTKELKVEGFNAIDFATSGEVYLSQGEGWAVKVESHQNIIDNLKAEVSGETLQLGFDKSVSSYESLKFYITMPALTGLNIAGSGDVIGETAFTGGENTEVNIAGSGNVKLRLEAGYIDVSIAGSGDIQLEGTAEAVEVNIMGSGSVKADKLSTKTAEVSIAGSGDCTIDATESLEASIAGSGDVYYLGEPEVESSIAGSGSVKKK
ncbi:MAG: DUF2807 domain-containing protein [Phaeodactylibacter sp.]|nr:DUF2807 domain-containing protein [Phaeodactylibacter sp.]